MLEITIGRRWMRLLTIWGKSSWGPGGRKVCWRCPLFNGLCNRSVTDVHWDLEWACGRTSAGIWNGARRGCPLRPGMAPEKVVAGMVLRSGSCGSWTRNTEAKTRGNKLQKKKIGIVSIGDLDKSIRKYNPFSPGYYAPHQIRLLRGKVEDDKTHIKFDSEYARKYVK